MIFMAKLIDITGKALSGEWGLDDDNGSGIPVLRTTNFTNEGIVNYDNVVTRKISKKNISEKFLKKGDILIEKSGGSDKFPVGRVIYYDGENDKYLFNNFTGLLRIKNVTTWYPKYVFYSLFANYKRGGTRCFENKTTGLHNLKTDDYVQRYEIAELSIKKQMRICDNLDKIHSIIISQKKELSYLDELVKARFVEMFVDRGYPVKTIGDVIDRKITRVAKAFDKTDVIQYLDISSIDSSSKTVKKLTRYILAEAPSRAQYVLKYNDIMYSTVRPNLQNVAINTCSEENVVGSTGFCILRCIGVTVGYMWGVMNSISFTEAMTNQATGASYPAVTDKVVYSYKIPIPPKEEQIVYEQLVRQIAKSKAVIEKSLKELETLQASLMQKYFS